MSGDGPSASEMGLTGKDLGRGVTDKSAFLGKPSAAETERKPRVSVYRVLLDSGAVTPTPSRDPEFRFNRPFTLNVARAVEALSQMEKPERADLPPGSEEDRAQLLVDSRRLLPVVATALVDHEIMPPGLQQQVARFLAPEDVVVNAGNIMRFVYVKDEFPQPGEERGVLEVGSRYHHHALKKVRQMAEEAGISLPPQAVQEIALRRGIGHEHGHAVVTAMRLSAVENTLTQGSDAAWEIGTNTEHQLYKTVHAKIAPRVELTQVLGEDIDPRSTHASINGLTSERIAAGFELLGLEYGLIAAGLSQSDVEAYMRIVSNNMREEFQRGADLITYVHSKGFSTEAMGEAENSLRIALRKAGHEDLATYFPVSYGYRLLGYSTPLSREEIKKFTSQEQSN